MTEKTTEEKPSGSYMVVGRARSGMQRTAASYEVITVEEAATKWADQWMTENQAIVEVFRGEELVRKFHLKRRPDGWLLDDAKTETEKPVERIVFAQRERNTTTSAKATVQVILEIAASGTWGRDSTLAQVDTQAIDSAQQRLARIVNIAAKDGIDIKVLGAPSIVSIGFDSKPR